MQYISAREAAARWGAHIRVVQNLCRAGRIPGARKYGNVWMLPEDTVKPGDPRRERKNNRDSRPHYDGSGLLTMATVSMPKGHAVPPEVLGSQDQLPQLTAEFAFLRGDLATAARAFETIGRGNDMSLCAVALTMAAASRTNDWARFADANEFLHSVYAAGDERDRKIAGVALSTALLSQFAIDLVPPWILEGQFSFVPVEARPMSVYLYAKSLKSRQRTDELLAVCRTGRALWARDDRFSMLDVYLSLLLAGACRARDDETSCRRALEHAAEMAVPYGFIAPFAEYRQLMAEDMDAVLHQWAPDWIERVQTLGEQIRVDWNAFHARFIRENLEKLLTPQEHQVAQYIARGEAYREVAQELALTQSELKQTLASIYQKLYITDRSELARFML